MNWKGLDMAKRRGSRFLAFLPMVLGTTWILLPLLILAIAPFTLQLRNPMLTTAYIGINVAAFIVGYILATSRLAGPVAHYGAIRPIRRPPWLHRALMSATLLSVLILPASVYVYTGKSILDIGVIFDQNAAYISLADIIEGDDSGARKVVSLLRGLAAPLTLTAVNLATFYWQSLRSSEKICAVLVASTYILFSAFRGTDKEIGDLLVLILTGVIARLAYLHSNVKPITTGSLAKTAGLGFLLIAVFIVVFVLRKSDRYGGFVAFCLYGDVACFEPTGNDDLSNVLGFGAAMFASYLGQGYYGLSLALSTNWEWTWGIGHSRPLLTLFGLIFDTQTLYEHGLMAQLRGAGWDDRYVWSSIFPALASDLGFAGVPIFFAVIGAIYSKAWISLIKRGEAAAVVSFSLLTILVLYTPANHQLAQSFDFYFASIVWIGAFVLWPRKHVRRQS